MKRKRCALGSSRRVPYVELDVKGLMVELKNSEKETIDSTLPEKSDVPIKANTPSVHARKRSSLMDNNKMRYVYSSSKRILHDRDCEFVHTISDSKFRMLMEFDPTMKTCNCCYRQALVRAGVADDGKFICAYLRFFDTVQASDKELYLLFICMKASCKIIDRYSMIVDVKDYRWKVVFNPTENIITLYHNNYFVLDDYTRHFDKEFHYQMTVALNRFEQIMQTMLRYSWNQHVEHLKAIREKIL